MEWFSAGAGLFVSGLLLQLFFGPVDWDFFAWPVNLAVLVLYVSLLALAHLSRGRVALFRSISGIPASTASIVWSSVLTVAMGLIRQRTSPSSSFPGFDHMIANWSFVLVWMWMLTSLGLTILRVCIPLRRKKIPFLLNHLGLFVAAVCAVLGSPDVQCLKMVARAGESECCATDVNGRVHELPISVELKSFEIDCYPPKFFIADSRTGRFLPEGSHQCLMLEEIGATGKLAGWNVEICEMFGESVPYFRGDTLMYRHSVSPGACPSAYVAVSGAEGVPVEGWVSCGSGTFTPRPLALDGQSMLVMTEPEPRSYLSAVSVHTRDGLCREDTIRVNRPCRVNGWKIYQYNYDHSKGRWSDYSVFEIIRDPWLPAVYAGLFMMLAGSACMFVKFGTTKKKARQ